MEAAATASGVVSRTIPMDESSVRNLREVEPLEASPNTEADGSTSGLISLTPAVREAPVESLLEVEPLEPPLESETRLGDLAKAATSNKPVRMSARKSPWMIVKVVGFLLAGPIIFGVGYHVAHSYSLRQIEKARREASLENVDSKYASPASPSAAANAAVHSDAKTSELDPLAGTPGHEGPKPKETLQGDLAFAMHQAEGTVKRMEKGETSIFDQDLADQVKEILRLRGELGLPNRLICKPGSGPDTSGPLGKWIELQAILHPERYPGCEARVEKP
jgi:hypothetical protein